MTDDKIRENRLRRMAERQGLAITRSRRRDRQALDYGLYYVRTIDTDEPVTPTGGISLQAVEAFLTTPIAERGQQ